MMFNITFYLVCYLQSVTLHRNGCGQKVGLTLCYGSPYDGFTDVFVGEVRNVVLTRSSKRPANFQQMYSKYTC